MMETLMEKYQLAKEEAEQILAITIGNWVEAREKQPENERLKYLAANAVEFAHIHKSAMDAAASIGVSYFECMDDEAATSGLYESYRAVDHLYSTAPNERLQITREYILAGMSAVKDRDSSQLLEILTGLATITTTARKSLQDIEKARLEAV